MQRLGLGVLCHCLITPLTKVLRRRPRLMQYIQEPVPPLIKVEPNIYIYIYIYIWYSDEIDSIRKRLRDLAEE
jgi:hypothetical protein